MPAHEVLGNFLVKLLRVKWSKLMAHRPAVLGKIKRLAKRTVGLFFFTTAAATYRTFWSHWSHLYIPVVW